MPKKYPKTLPETIEKFSARRLLKNPIELQYLGHTIFIEVQYPIQKI